MVNEHRGGFLNVIYSGMKKWVERKVGAFGEIHPIVAPRHVTFLHPICNRRRFESIESQAHRRFIVQCLNEHAEQLVAHKRACAGFEFFGKLHLFCFLARVVYEPMLAIISFYR